MQKGMTVTKLASNQNAVLFKCHKEYWIVCKEKPNHRLPDGWRTVCFNEQSDEYTAEDALKSFEKECGPATWVHNHIGLF